VETSAMMGGVGWFARAGLAVMLLGALGDAAFHVLGANDSAFIAALSGPDGQYPHSVTLAGMLLVLAGVVRRGMAAQPREPRPTSLDMLNTEERPNAIR
jgi:hypothetical protein